MSSGVASQPATGHDCGGGTLAMAQAYNVTPFLDSHPGGAKVILAYAGKDATGDFTMLHRPGILEKVRRWSCRSCPPCASGLDAFDSSARGATLRARPGRLIRQEGPTLASPHCCKSAAV